jgi:hypothetical protein
MPPYFFIWRRQDFNAICFNRKGRTKSEKPSGFASLIEKVALIGLKYLNPEKDF